MNSEISVDGKIPEISQSSITLENAPNQAFLYSNIVFPIILKSFSYKYKNPLPEKFNYRSEPNLKSMFYALLEGLPIYFRAMV